MYQTYGCRSFADGRSYPLYASSADIAYSEYSGKAGLEHLRNARQRPVEVLNHGIEIASGENEALVIHGHAAVQPIGARRASRHDEDVPDVMG